MSYCTATVMTSVKIVLLSKPYLLKTLNTPLPKVGFKPPMPLVFTVGHTNPPMLSYFISFTSILISSSFPLLAPLSGPYPSGSSPKFCMYFPSPHTCHMPYPSHPLAVGQHNKILWVHITKLLITQFSPVSSYPQMYSSAFHVFHILWPTKFHTHTQQQTGRQKFCTEQRRV